MIKESIDYAVAVAATTLRRQAIEDNDWRIKNAERLIQGEPSNIARH